MPASERTHSAGPARPLTGVSCFELRVRERLGDYEWSCSLRVLVWAFDVWEAGALAIRHPRALKIPFQPGMAFCGDGRPFLRRLPRRAVALEDYQGQLPRVRPCSCRGVVGDCGPCDGACMGMR